MRVFLYLCVLSFLVTMDAHSQTNSDMRSSAFIHFSFFEAYSGVNVRNVDVGVFIGDSLIARANSDTASKLFVMVPDGKYNLIVRKEGYLEKKFKEYSITQGQGAFLRISMIRKPVTAN
jgi:hypothetical protein